MVPRCLAPVEPPVRFSAPLCRMFFEINGCDQMADATQLEYVHVVRRGITLYALQHAWPTEWLMSSVTCKCL